MAGNKSSGSARGRRTSLAAEVNEKPSNPAPEQCETATSPDEWAIGSSDEEDEDMVQTQMNLTQSRMQHKHCPRELRRKVIPFHWAPMLSPLIPADAEACVSLNRAALPDISEACTRDKVEYCVRTCGNLCFGLFNTCRPSEATDFRVHTLPYARQVETGRSDQSQSVMFAHFIATLGTHPVVTNDDIKIPSNWRDLEASLNSPFGHQSTGRTLCLHSFCVCPETQGIGLGKFAMKAYIQAIIQSAVADRIALICKKSLVDFFVRFGFQNLGHSATTVAGSDWYSMVLPLPGPESFRPESFRPGSFRPGPLTDDA